MAFLGSSPNLAFLLALCFLILTLHFSQIVPGPDTVLEQDLPAHDFCWIDELTVVVEDPGESPTVVEVVPADEAEDEEASAMSLV